MIDYAIRIAFALVALAFLFAFARLLAGPSVVDRILALDTLYVNTIALVVLAGMATGLTLFFESALLVAMMGFVGTVALAKYLLRGDIIE